MCLVLPPGAAAVGAAVPVIRASDACPCACMTQPLYYCHHMVPPHQAARPACKGVAAPADDMPALHPMADLSSHLMVLPLHGGA